MCSIKGNSLICKLIIYIVKALHRNAVESLLLGYEITSLAI